MIRITTYHVCEGETSGRVVETISEQDAFGMFADYLVEYQSKLSEAKPTCVELYWRGMHGSDNIRFEGDAKDMRKIWMLTELVRQPLTTRKY